jgi:hypothetical protein
MSKYHWCITTIQVYLPYQRQLVSTQIHHGKFINTRSGQALEYRLDTKIAATMLLDELSE